MAACVTSAHRPARHGAGSHRHYPAWLRHGVVGFEQRFPHGVGDGARDQQQVRKSWRRSEEDSQAMQVVIRIVQRLQLRFAAVARAGIHVANMKTSPERAVDLCFEVARWL